MNTLSDLRSTLGEHAEQVPDGEAVARTAAVRHRVSVVRRRRRAVGAGVLSLALLVGGAATLANRGHSDALPSAPTVLGVQAPTTMTSLGYTYRTDGHVRGLRPDRLLEVDRSDQPAARRVDDRPTPPRCGSQLPDGEVVHLDRDGLPGLRRHPARRERHARRCGGRRAGSGWRRTTLTDAAPPRRTRKDGITFREDRRRAAPARCGDLATRGSPSSPRRSSRPEAQVQDHAALRRRRAGPTRAPGRRRRRPREWVRARHLRPRSAFDPGSDGIGQFRDRVVRDSARPCRLYVTRRRRRTDESCRRESGPGFRIGFGIYGPIVESSGRWLELENQHRVAAATPGCWRGTEELGAAARPITGRGVPTRDRLASVAVEQPVRRQQRSDGRAGPHEQRAAEEVLETGQRRRARRGSGTTRPVHRSTCGSCEARGTLGLALSRPGGLRDARPSPTCPESDRSGERIRLSTRTNGDTATGGRGSEGNAFLADEVLAAELAAEQMFVDRVYVQLEKSARNARELAREGHGRGRLGHEGGLVERDAMVFQAAKRIAQLDAAHEGLVFGRLDLRGDARPGAALHRPDRPARRAPRLAADRLARACRRRLLPGHGRRAPGRRTPAGAALRRADRGRRGGRAPRRRGRDRPPDRRRGCADGAALPCPRPVDALDRGDHPGRAGQGDPGAGEGSRRDQWRPGHRQDGRRPAPRGVPALLRPPSLRDRRRAGGRPLRRLHALHRARPAVARRDGRGAPLAGRGGRRACARRATTPRRSPPSRARSGWPS